MTCVSPSFEIPKPSSPIHEQSASDSTAPESEGICRYAGKRCFNLRVRKRDGALHTLCHVHRVRANQNQRRMQLRRRIARKSSDQSLLFQEHFSVLPPESSMAMLQQQSLYASAVWNYLGGAAPGCALMQPPASTATVVMPAQDLWSELLLLTPDQTQDHCAADLMYTPLKLHDEVEMLTRLVSVGPDGLAMSAGANLSYPGLTSHHFALPHEPEFVWSSQALMMPPL